MNSLQSGFIARMAAAVYNGPLKTVFTRYFTDIPQISVTKTVIKAFSFTFN